ncbi:MAG: hypothetical protein MRERV_32c050 [Mycoplasmataceae bacterium RV_VA103A]|nr:MAG: hypothetical protein MRERV_32c050 [Mycoplasmataceae bacterium RV_VA103A]
MAKTIEEIINKIDEKLAKELDRSDAEELLNDLNVDFGILNKNTETKYKEITEKKIKELKKVISKNLLADEEPGWTKTQDDLNGIKKGLKELQGEIKKSEEQENEMKNNYEKVKRERDEYKIQTKQLAVK